MAVVQFVGIVLASMLAMELASYCLHRFLFHTILWRIHKTHHEKSHGTLELNDIFSAGFAALAVYLIWDGSRGDLLTSVSLPAGIGITLYGVLYFVIHDLFTHRRFAPFSSNNRLMQIVRRAHQRHHQSVDRPGNEPYGLFLFDFESFRRSPREMRKREIESSRGRKL